jgi:hypothetical protein
MAEVRYDIGRRRLQYHRGGNRWADVAGGTLTSDDAAKIAASVVPAGGGSGPALGTTVVTETAFGQASAVGTSANAAREDHSHGTPAAPSGGGLWGTTTVNLGTNAVNGSFTIADGAITAGMKLVVAWLAVDDEPEFDGIACAARLATAGSVVVHWRATGPRNGDHVFVYGGG